MNRSLIRGIAAALLAWLGASSAPAQYPPAGPTPASAGVSIVESVPECGPCQKVVHPVVENVPHTCISYDCKEEDYSYTKGVRLPILSRFCRDCCGKCDGCPNPAEPCHDCGQARTRKVLIKVIVTEPVPTPKCQVERVPIAHPAEPPCSGNVEDMVLHEGETLDQAAPKK